ncbi:hypothetical protein [Gordonia sp. NPDC003376]
MHSNTLAPPPGARVQGITARIRRMVRNGEQPFESDVNQMCRWGFDVDQIIADARKEN